jgi:hypothetical protein
MEENLEDSVSRIQILGSEGIIHSIGTAPVPEDLPLFQ